ncbi:copper chaperone PCu(A)C [Neisseria sp. P0020.S003]|uniref:copper chaperone PCu(A)C n=1 Tax=Neisseria sp. P0020.S003 TaxID=3436808 RepID=UPI003F80D81D
MKKLMATLILAGLATSVSAAGIHIEDGWARSTVEGMKMGGAFMKIHNDEAKKDFLVGGSSPVAERIEVHTHVNDNGVMRMREVKGGIPLEEKGVTELKPGSYHVMFMGLKKTLKEGEKVPVTLKFKNAKPQTVQLEVKTAPQSGMDHGHGHGGAHQH